MHKNGEKCLIGDDKKFNFKNLNPLERLYELKAHEQDNPSNATNKIANFVFKRFINNEDYFNGLLNGIYEGNEGCILIAQRWLFNDANLKLWKSIKQRRTILLEGYAYLDKNPMEFLLGICLYKKIFPFNVGWTIDEKTNSTHFWQFFAKSKPCVEELMSFSEEVLSNYKYDATDIQDYLVFEKVVLALMDGDAECSKILDKFLLRFINDEKMIEPLKDRCNLRSSETLKILNLIMCENKNPTDDSKYISRELKKKISPLYANKSVYTRNEFKNIIDKQKKEIKAMSNNKMIDYFDELFMSFDSFKNNNHGLILELYLNTKREWQKDLPKCFDSVEYGGAIFGQIKMTIDPIIKIEFDNCQKFTDDLNKFKTRARTATHSFLGYSKERINDYDIVFALLWEALEKLADNSDNETYKYQLLSLCIDLNEMIIFDYLKVCNKKDDEKHIIFEEKYTLPNTIKEIVSQDLYGILSEGSIDLVNEFYTSPQEDSPIVPDFTPHLNIRNSFIHKDADITVQTQYAFVAFAILMNLINEILYNTGYKEQELNF